MAFADIPTAFQTTNTIPLISVRARSLEVRLCTTQIDFYFFAFNYSTRVRMIAAGF